MSTGNIARRWRELSGQNHWNGLLGPLDMDLRRYLLHYGQMAQATYDSFIAEKMSQFAGNSRYSMKNLFSSVGLTINNIFKYKPVKYLYATSSAEVPQSFIMNPSTSQQGATKESNWIGYIAVAEDEAKKELGRRDIVVAWRGTIQPLEWIEDFNAPLIPATDILGRNKNARVHRGFHSVYTSTNPASANSKTSAREQVFEAVKQLVNQYQNEEISITVIGHSLGAALATMSSADIVTNGLNRSDSNATKSCPVTAFAYACPRTGDQGFRHALDDMQDLRILRIKNAPDIVPQVPPVTVGYRDIGEELLIDTRMSPYLQPPGGFLSWHMLETYLHGIAGTQGNNPFNLAVNRDISLVNKSSNLLKPEHNVPGYWWSTANHGMSQQPDGAWKLDPSQDSED
ncbi:phospholipase A1-IIgamma-like [Mercurialis annua]|uniref:phospholipase A1-IIgamma-like n=1 Tax=Mercurialis annua TaxID=3986 RepID=UPI002160516C|nr:phospholipase A1-IIgamma-like [Mercurialis annua]